MTEMEIEPKEIWEPSEGICFTKHPFIGVTQDHLSLRTIGEPIVIEEKYGDDWLRGHTLITERKGIFPKNFVKRDTKRTLTKEHFLSSNCHPVREFDPVILESEHSLKQYSLQLLSKKTEELNLKYSEFQAIMMLMNQILKYRLEFLSNMTASESLFAIKQRIVSNLDQMNEFFSIKKQIRRANGDPVLIDYLGFSKAHELYLQNCQQSISSQRRDHEINKSDTHYQILIDFQMLISKMKDPYSIMFQIYSHQKNQMVSESFVVYSFGRRGGSDLNVDVKSLRQEMPLTTNRFDNRKNKTIFLDLNEKDLSSDLFLVSRIYRRGLLNPELKKNKSKKIDNYPEYRIPFGCSVHKLDQNFIKRSTNEKQNLNLPIFTTQKENKFNVLHELIIDQNEKATQLEGPIGISFAMKIYRGEYKAIVNTYPDYDGNALKDIPTTIKTSLPEIILPNYQRNDLYITLNSLNIVNAKKAKNFELRMWVRKRIEANQNNGNQQQKQKQKQSQERNDEFFYQKEKAISYGSSDDKKKMFISYICGYRSNPKWNETIKINIPPEEYPNVELFLEIYHCKPTKSYLHSIGAVRLTNRDCSIIAQGEKTIDLFKWDAKLAKKNPFYYMPNEKESKERHSKVQIFKSALTFNINLCSTSLTQQEKLISFLNWRFNINSLDQVFQKLKYVNGEEKIKFIIKILNTLFEILNERGGQKQVQERIFEEILNFYTDIMKIQGFRSVLDHVINDYYNFENQKLSFTIKKNFSLIYLPLLTTLTNIFKIEEGNKMRKVIQTMKGLNFIFKLIIQSFHFNQKFNSQNQKNNNQNNKYNQNNNQMDLNSQQQKQHKELQKQQKQTQKQQKQIQKQQKELQKQWKPQITQNRINSDHHFIRQFNKLMNLFSDFMSLTKPKWVKSAQNVALKHFSTMFTDLLKILDKNIITNSLIKMIKSVNVEGRDLMRKDKLIWIKSIINGQLIEQSKSREIIIKIIKEQINSNIVKGEMYLEICASIMNSLFIQTFEKSKKNDLNQWIIQLIPFLKEILRGLEYNDKLKQQIMKKKNKCIEEQQNNNQQEFKKLQKLNLKFQDLQKTQKETTINNQESIQQIKSRYQIELQKQLVVESSLISSFISLFHMMNHQHISILINIYPKNSVDQILFLEQILKLFLYILTKKKRLILNNQSNQLSKKFHLVKSMNLSISKILIIIEFYKNISQLLIANFLDGNYQFNIWRLFILSLLEFINLPELRLKFNTNNINHNNLNIHNIKNKNIEKITNKNPNKNKNQNKNQNKNTNRIASKSIRKRTSNYNDQRCNNSNNYLLNPEFFKEQYLDLREIALIILDNCFYHLNEKILNFIPTDIEHFLTLLLLDNTELVNFGFEFYFKFFLEEFKSTGDIKGIEQGTVSMVCNIIDTNEEEKFFENFFLKFEEKLQEWESLKEYGRHFLNQLKQLIEKITKLKDFKGSNFEEEKCQVLMDIIDYLYKTKRYQMFAKYCQLLSNLHLQNKNFTEAGLSLVKLIKILDWDPSNQKKTKSKIDDIISNLNKFNQRQFQIASKENLLKKIIYYLNKGESWELAIKYLQLLKAYYLKTYNYSKLSTYLSNESEFYKNIVTVERFYSTYFRVGYFGNGFNGEQYPGIKDQTFIYKGEILEKLPEFMDKLKEKYTNATIDSKDPTKEQMGGNGQYIQVCAVLPSSEGVIVSQQNKKAVNSHSIPEKILKHQTQEKINVFVYSQPFRKSKTKSQNQFANLWIKNHYFITAKSFPTTCRRLKVHKRIINEISPIQNGINSIKQKNIELISIITKYQTETILNINPLSMILNGIIDAPVNGGIYMYVNAFLEEQYLLNNPKHEDLIIKMKKMLVKQLKFVNIGLNLHNRLCQDNFRPFHDKMKRKFNEMEKKLAFYLSITQKDQDN
ncbi:dedicator of cytokinesis [Anaeramoeba flamelloides]|uniref:Dedicator of cytokinesis n=1 Tax=Anaeramoeba flamelloides TaxID=1746091 RepID=A0ABQ8ZG55_9EUKA|nr:dedicator of cytokinesis [Anaeramoeba flamelloides]